MAWRLVLLLLFALPAWAQDQTLIPTGDDDATMSSEGYTDISDSGCTNECWDSDACYLHLDEDPSGVGDNAIVASTVENEQGIFTFNTPTSPPSQTALAQTFNLSVSECDDGSCVESSGNGEPTVWVYLWCNGVEIVAVLQGGTLENDEEDEYVTIDWTFPGSGGGCADDGSDVAIGLNVSTGGGGSNERHICYEAVEWEVTWASEGRSRRAIIVD